MSPRGTWRASFASQGDARILERVAAGTPRGTPRDFGKNHRLRWGLAGETGAPHRHRIRTGFSPPEETFSRALRVFFTATRVFRKDWILFMRLFP